MYGKRILGSGVLLIGLTAAGCQRATVAVDQMPTVELDGTTYRISGPHAHENLTVYLLHTETQDDRDFITLDQGLKEGVVKVMEQQREGLEHLRLENNGDSLRVQGSTGDGARVDQLQIENTGDLPLFLQEGDRLQGGKQDRTIMASLVIPPRSGKMPVPTYCIEQSRWRYGARGLAFEPTANAAFAPKDVRFAAKVGKDQNAVWENVRGQKARANDAQLAGVSNSSLNETLDAPEVKKISDEFAAALSAILKEHPHAVGVAIAVNGKIEEVNVYPNHKLLSKLYPRLLQSYALQATLEKDKAKDAKPVAPEDLVQFLAEGKAEAARVEALNEDNKLAICDVDGGRTKCSTAYKGAPVHTQLWVLPEGAGAKAPSSFRNVDGVPVWNDADPSALFQPTPRRRSEPTTTQTPGAGQAPPAPKP